MDDFARYFEYTWIGTTWQRALFPPSAWNHHDASLALLPRSSNMAEGWHNGFRSLVRCSNPTIWSFLDALKLEQGLTDQKIANAYCFILLPPDRRSGLTLTISYRSLLTPMIMNSMIATSTSTQQFHQFCFKTLFMPFFMHPDLSTSVYRKPTNTDSYTYYSTSAPQSTKDSLIRSLTRRAYDICSPQHLQHEQDHICTVLLDNGYPLSRIAHVMHRTKQSIDLPASAPTQTDKHSVKVFIPYYSHVNKQISSILQRHSVSSACTSNKNLRDLLSSTKSRQPASPTSNVIYQIPCKDCSATYCGQTSRPLHKHIAEHERYTRPAYSHSTDLQQSSAIAQHAHASGHEIDFSSAVILAKLQHQQQLDLIEHAAITILEPSLNRNHAAPSINPQWHPILQTICE